MNNLLLSEFAPNSELVVPATAVSKPMTPVIDFHNHLFARTTTAASISSLVQLMDACDVELMVDLTVWHEGELFDTINRYEQVAPGRFAVFTCLDAFVSAHIDDKDFGRQAAAYLEKAVEGGAKGLKVYKRLGLEYKDGAGNLIAPDDARLAPIWRAAAKLGVPVLIHVADPVAFFRPIDWYNERYEELQRHPNWSFSHLGMDYFQKLMEAVPRLLQANPDTTFVFAHIIYPENLAYASRILDTYPNAYVDVSARFAEIGRQPKTAAQFITKYKERVLFGTDIYPSQPEIFTIPYRILETTDEYFPYVPAGKLPGQGRWNVYGLGLNPEVLRAVYRDNAQRLLRLR